MEPDDKNDFKYTFTWKVDDQGHHPYTYNWFNVMSDKINETNRHQNELEWELAEMDLIDYLVENMTAFPDAEEIVQKIQENLSR